MGEKAESWLRQAIHAAIIAGAVILFIGLYYCVVKAGIPCQDPPLDVRIQYEVDMRIGEVLVGTGSKIAVCGGIIRFALSLVWKKRQKK